MPRFLTRRRLLALALLAAPAAIASSLLAETATVPDFDAACSNGQPWSIASAFRGQTSVGREPGASGPSVLLFQDTPQDRVHYTLATFRDTGAVWGLGYSREQKSVYAATYHKRGLPYGPLGAGGIYRIDLETAEITEFATVPDAGRQRGGSFPDGSLDHDQATARQVGKTALGDLDLSSDGRELFVMNLDSRKIYRYSVPDGTLLGSFDHGAANERWDRDARPFALATFGGKLYHGVVNSAGNGPALVAKIYRSNYDGSAMEDVATLGLKYTRDNVRLRDVPASVSWAPWTDRVDPPSLERPRAHNPQPMLTDIVFTEDGTMAIALRDRYWDISNPYIQSVASTPTMEVHPITTPTPSVNIVAEEGIGFGDILMGRPDAGTYLIETEPEHFDDTNGMNHAESAMGGLSCVADAGIVGATAYGVEEARSDRVAGDEGAYWFDVGTGNKTGHEVVDRPGSFQDYSRLVDGSFASAHTLEPVTYVYEFYRELGSLGDIETLCEPCDVDVPTPTPTDGPSPTPGIPTDTPTSTSTNTPTDTPTPTNTPTPEPEPIYLPILLREECDPEKRRADVVLVIDASSSMIGPKIAAAKDAAIAFIETMSLPHDQVGVAAFNTTGWTVSTLSGNQAELAEAIRGIEPSPGTRIDLGLEQAREILDRPERRPGAPVVVVLTDGLQMIEPEKPIEIASELRRMNVEMFAVGLGTDVDVVYLTRLVGSRSRVRISPTPEELAGIYRQIAIEIPCDPMQFWGRR